MPEQSEQNPSKTTQATEADQETYVADPADGEPAAGTLAYGAARYRARHGKG